MNHKKLQFDIRAASLLAPAIAYTVGLVLYSGEGLFPGALTMHAARLVGAWLMVAGAEGGTLSAIIEVARKIGIGRARWYDYAGIVVSMFATVFNLLLVWSRESTLTNPPGWSRWMQINGALCDILAQVGDFYAGAAFELGLYYAYIREERREAALQDERDALGVYRARLQIERERRELETANGDDAAILRRQNAELTAALQRANAELDATDRQQSAIPAPVAVSEPPQTANSAPMAASGDAAPRLSPAEWRAIFASLNGDRPTTAAGVNRWLAENGYAQVPGTTARRWAKTCGNE